MANETEVISIHSYPVKVVWQEDRQVVYSCPWDNCNFQTSYPCDAEDAECRLDAYVEMHDHIKAHLAKK